MVFTTAGSSTFSSSWVVYGTLTVVIIVLSFSVLRIKVSAFFSYKQIIRAVLMVCGGIIGFESGCRSNIPIFLTQNNPYTRPAEIIYSEFYVGVDILIGIIIPLSRRN